MCKLIGPTFNEEAGFSRKKKKKKKKNEEAEASYSPTSFPLFGVFNIRDY